MKGYDYWRDAWPLIVANALRDGVRFYESIDVLDAVGTNIRIDAREQHVMRVLPRENARLGDVVMDPRIYRMSPEAERMPVLSGAAAERAAARDQLPPLGDAEEQVAKLQAKVDELRRAK